LAIVLPGIMHIMRSQKKEKIIQLGERVCKITKGSEDERINQTIQMTIEFFESLGVPTRLSDYNVSMDTIDKICIRFEEKGTKLGEKANIGALETRLILENRL